MLTGVRGAILGVSLAHAVPAAHSAAGGRGSPREHRGNAGASRSVLVVVALFLLPRLAGYTHSICENVGGREVGGGVKGTIRQ